jgi:hypothetical protein
MGEAGAKGAQVASKHAGIQAERRPSNAQRKLITSHKIHASIVKAWGAMAEATHVMGSQNGATKVARQGDKGEGKSQSGKGIAKRGGTNTNVACEEEHTQRRLRAMGTRSNNQV